MKNFKEIFQEYILYKNNKLYLKAEDLLVDWFDNSLRQGHFGQIFDDVVLFLQHEDDLLMVTVVFMTLFQARKVKAIKYEALFEIAAKILEKKYSIKEIQKGLGKFKPL